MAQMSPPLVPIFDLDGTLIDSDDALVRPFLELGVAEEEISFGHPIVEECARLGISLDAYVEAYDTEVVAPYPGVAELIDGLGRWGICSNKDERSARRELDRLGWQPEVAMFAGDFGGRAKSLRPVIDAMRLEPRQALFVGDTPHDLTCAAVAGTEFLWAAWNPRTAASGPEGPIASVPGDVRRALERSVD